MARYTNLLTTPYEFGDSHSHNGILYTANEDGSITVTGTATDWSQCFLWRGDSTKIYNCILSCDAEDVVLRHQMYASPYTTYNTVTTGRSKITDGVEDAWIGLSVSAGTAVNETIHPKLLREVNANSNIDIIDTSFKVLYDMIDISADDDATLSATTMSANANINNLLDDRAEHKAHKWLTREHNYNVLDGSREIAKQSYRFYYNSTSFAKSDGTFKTNPTLTAVFEHNHSSVGITMYFDDFHPLECKVEWYGLDGVIISSCVAKITKSIQEVRHPVQNYGKIVITFTKAMPDHFVKMYRLRFGVALEFDETQIQAGTLVESLDRFSNQLAINKLNYSIVDLFEDFNLGNSDGIHSYIQFGQTVQPVELLRGESTDLGRYFVSTFSGDKSLIKFSNVDYLGLLDKVTFYKGDLWNGTKAGVIIDSIMKTADIEEYTISDEVYNTLVYGTIVPMTCRKALREVCFAVGAVVNTARTDTLDIFMPSSKITTELVRSNKISTKTTRREYVSGVAIKHTEYTTPASTSSITGATLSGTTLVLSSASNQQAAKIVSGNYVKGDNLITWNAPRYNISATSGTIKESGKYYCILNLSADANVTINGYSYTASTVTTQVDVDELDGGKTANVKSFNCNLVNAITAEQAAKRILDYYAYELQLDVQYLADNESILDWAVVENPEKLYNDFVAGYESINTDLTGGFVATAKLIGYYNLPNNSRYLRETDTEMFTSAKDDIGLI